MASWDNQSTIMAMKRWPMRRGSEVWVKELYYMAKVTNNNQETLVDSEKIYAFTSFKRIQKILIQLLKTFFFHFTFEI